MKVFSSIYTLAYLAIVVSALAKSEPSDQNPLVMNENVLAVPDSVITGPVEAINPVGNGPANNYGDDGDDDEDEECDIDNDIFGQLATNDPRCQMVRAKMNIACETRNCLGTAGDNTGGWCRYNSNSKRCCMVKMRGRNAHVSCLHCRCKRA